MDWCVKIGNGKHVFIVGPDSPQTMEQTLTIAKQAKALGEKYGILDRMIIRGGAFKPRTRPTDWRDLDGKVSKCLTVLEKRQAYHT